MATNTLTKPEVYSTTDESPSVATPTKAEAYARAEQRMRRGKQLVISGFIVAVVGIVAYCVASLSAGVNQELGSALLESPGWLVGPTLGMIGLGTLLWLMGSFVYLNAAMDSDPNGPDRVQSSNPDSNRGAVRTRLPHPVGPAALAPSSPPDVDEGRSEGRLYEESIEHFANFAQSKVSALKHNPVGFFIGAMMAGAYVGFGIVLIFILGSDVEPQGNKLIMGAAFGIALTLVVFAGSELFTGHNMYMPLAWLKKKIKGSDLAAVWATVWVGNMAGSVFLAGLFVLGGAGGIGNDSGSFLNQVASTKMNAPAVELLARGMLCNWLVCLALWMSGRTTNDAAKCIVIFWCLFAFIASGFEHSVANMTLFSIALMGEHPEAVSLSGMGYNLLWVTIGNLTAGALFVAAGYWLYSGANRGR